MRTRGITIINILCSTIMTVVHFECVKFITTIPALDNQGDIGSFFLAKLTE